MSQRKPEELKDPRGIPIRLEPRQLLGPGDMVRASLFAQDAVAMSRFYDCPSLSYTYSEPIVWYEYMLDCAKAARRRNLKNVWVTCGYIQQEPLEELCQWIDAASVNLKSFSDDIYRILNTGKLQPVLDTLLTLKRLGVWFEIVNLIVPTYTDKPDMIRQMCDWILENLGPEYPLHFSRFMPHHKLLHLEQTPKSVLEEARDIARKAGLHYVYIGNCEDAEDGGTTYCPNCRQEVVTRRGFFVTSMNLNDGKCAACGTRIAGVWKA
jgi:pyruvate formate lyase activating enzyme